MSVNTIFKVGNHLATIEQSAIISAIISGSNDIMVNAFAGTGKTTTLVGIAEYLSGFTILYLAFSSAMEKSAKIAFGSLRVTIKTVHAFALPFIIERGETVRGKNYNTAEIARILNISKKDAYGVSVGFENFCNSSSSSVSTLLGNNSSIRLFFDMMDRGDIQKTHSFYLKKFHLNLLNDIPMGVPTFAILMLDEYQDTNDVTKDIVRLLGANQVIKVGDFYQSIFAFRGATNAMDNHSGEKFYLTQSFRFGKEIADKASWFLSTFRGESRNIVGLGNTKTPYTAITLSRTNAYLIRAIMDFISAGKYYKTIRDPALIFELPINIALLNENKVEMVSRKYISLTWGHEVYLKEEDKYDSFSDYVVKKGQEEGNLEEVWAGLLANKYTFRELQDAYSETISNNRNSDPCGFFVGTAHSAKGLEFDLVKLTEDFRDFFSVIARWYIDNEDSVEQSPSSYLDYFRINALGGFVGSDIIEEFNLFYVAITRARIKVYLDKNIPEYFSLSEKQIDMKIKDEIKDEKKKRKARGKWG